RLVGGAQLRVLADEPGLVSHGWLGVATGGRYAGRMPELLVEAALHPVGSGRGVVHAGAAGLQRWIIGLGRGAVVRGDGRDPQEERMPAVGVLADQVNCM